MDHDWKLKPLAGFSGRRGPVVLAIMDGMGIGRGDEADAVALARTPVLDALRKSGLFLPIRAHGTAVGMPSDDDMGNSEVGHNAMGAGRVYAQGALRVNDAIADRLIFSSETWGWLTGPCIDPGHPLHFIGLLSDGNVHSHIDHLFAFLEEARRIGIRKVFVHTLLDGRDVAQTSAHLFLAQLEHKLETLRGAGFQYEVASGGGRQKITMDRYGADWGMVKRGWDTHVLGRGRQFSSSLEALETLRHETPGVIDQNLPPFVIARGGAPIGAIQDGDGVVLFNFRGDRALELTMAFDQPGFSHFDRERVPQVRFAGIMQYDGDLKLPTHFLVSPPAISHTVGEYLARNQVCQCALSETQKFGHVTYFWNGNRSGMFDPAWETYREVTSDLAPFEERPWMKAAEITDLAIEQILGGHCRLIRLNFANGDMVGHTGLLEPTILAVEAVDLSLGRLKRAVEEAGGILVVTADHGNADEMYMRDARTGALEHELSGALKPKTSHTLNPVPFIIYDPQADGSYALNTELERPGLANIAATLLNLSGFQAPGDYEPSLIRVT